MGESNKYIIKWSVNKLNILVLATDYTVPNKKVASHFIHVRNKQYAKFGIKVDVVSFAAKYDYKLDGINVYTYNTYKNNLINKNYDILLSHAPNLRNHYRFLIKYGNNFNKIIFYFHGHEVLKESEVYPRPYKYVKKKFFLYFLFRNFYDKFKLWVWRGYFQKVINKSQFIFVSKWMYNMFIKFVRIDLMEIKERCHIIYNCIGEEFENNSYNKSCAKDYDFITIRNILDKSKYCIDIVNIIAENNPQYKFCVVGKGEFYKYNKKPDNLEWIDKNLTHNEIIDFLNRSKCALLPTRADAQGVMACEMATFGIPLITSDIEICKEIFEGFENVAFINNDEKCINIGNIFNKLIHIEVKVKNDKYFSKNTIGKEIEIFKRLKG